MTNGTLAALATLAVVLGATLLVLLLTNKHRERQAIDARRVVNWSIIPTGLALTLWFFTRDVHDAQSGVLLALVPSVGAAVSLTAMLTRGK